MVNIPQEIGNKIKIYRKKKNLTLLELSEAICKSKATVSKYENGQISLDIMTLYDIARVLGIHVEQLLYPVQDEAMNISAPRLPAFSVIRHSSICISMTGAAMRSAAVSLTYWPRRV